MIEVIKMRCFAVALVACAVLGLGCASLLSFTQSYHSHTHHILISLCVFLFFLLSGRAIAGTTDTPTEVTYEPEAKESEIQFVLSELKHYISDELNGNCNVSYWWLVNAC